MPVVQEAQKDEDGCAWSSELKELETVRVRDWDATWTLGGDGSRMEKQERRLLVGWMAHMKENELDRGIQPDIVMAKLE